MMFQKIAAQSYLIVIMAIGIVACSSSDDSVFEPSLVVPVKMEASDDINVFEDDLPRPLVVRIYQLQDLGTFKKTDFMSLYESDDEALAGSLVDSVTLPPLLPGEKRAFTLDVQKQSKFIAVFAEFANYDVAESKAAVALVEEPEDNPIIIRVSQSKIEVSQPVDSSWW